jgi:exopolysaccharide production protein ExoY
MSAPRLEFRTESAIRIPSSFYAPYGKRLLDLLVVLTILPVVVPLVIVILAVTAVSGGRPLYSQERVGKGRRVFRCWKIRTMVRDADSVLQHLVANDPDLAAEWSKNQKLVADPRVTAFGRLLRKTSLDELPQLWNVLTGTMSLVGPRPFTPDQTQMYLRGQRDVPYFHILPGITGLWQISLRSKGSFAERADYDQLYAGTIGLRQDLLILLRTVLVVIRGTGI